MQATPVIQLLIDLSPITRLRVPTGRSASLGLRLDLLAATVVIRVEMIGAIQTEYMKCLSPTGYSLR